MRALATYGANEGDPRVALSSGSIRNHMLVLTARLFDRTASFAASLAAMLEAPTPPASIRRFGPGEAAEDVTRHLEVVR
jgi:hypothetical protein